MAAPENRKPRLAGRGSLVISKGVATGNYQKPPVDTTKIAAAIVAARYRLPLHMARLVCELASIGGRLA